MSIGLYDNDGSLHLEGSLTGRFRGAGERIVARKDFVKLFSDFLRTHWYARTKPDVTLSGNKIVYDSNEAFWKDAIKGQLRPAVPVSLTRFHLVEWLPSSPGRYYTDEAASARIMAAHYISHFDSPNHVEYLPNGKSWSVLGGVGTIRLLPKPTQNGDLYFLGATSSGVCHQGIPIVTHSSEYLKVVNDIITSGGCIADIEGHVVSVPDTVQSKINHNNDIPKYFIFADKVTPQKTSEVEDILTTVAMMFSGGREEATVAGLATCLEKNWTFCSFHPSDREKDVGSAVEWMLDYAVRNSWAPDAPIFYDFDEHFDHFKGRLEIPISDAVNGSISPEIAAVYGNYYHITILEAYMENSSKYNISGGQQGAVGDNAKAENFTQNQASQQPLDLKALAEQLSKILETAQSKATEPEQQMEIGAIAAAKSAAEKGDEPKALMYLKSAGKWTLGIATDLSAKIVAEIISKHMGLG